MRRMIPLLVVFVLMIFALAVYAQTGTLQGKVSLPNGAPLDGAIFLLLGAVMVYGAQKMYKPE